MVLDLSECQLFTARHDVYSLIDPQSAFATKSFSGKVVLITGGSSGIGYATALMYAKAGARLVINGRNTSKLEAKKTEIEERVAGAEVLTVSGDMSEVEVGKKIVKAAVDAWGKVDIVIANSAIVMGGARLHEQDAVKWWYTQEVNVRGTLNIIHPAIPELLKTQGQIIVSTSDLSHVRFPVLFDASISKHTINRFVEILAIDYPELTVYAVHPGQIMTEGADVLQTNMGLKDKVPMPDTVELSLPAATYLWLTGRNAEFLSGRYVQATWDLGEVIAKKDEIVKDNLLVTKLAGPKSM